jgi:hypothetical protein
VITLCILLLIAGGPGGAPPAAPAVEAAATAAPCTCDVAIETNGWCEAHQLGFVGSIEIESYKLWEALDAHGHLLDPKNFECAACREAFATGGICAEHRLGFVDGLGYFSRLTYHLAKGKKRPLAGITCPACRRNALEHGWCEEHGLGMVGNIAIEGRSDWDHVAKAIGMLEAAIAAAPRCETCATAIALDGYCPFHQMDYRDGKAVPPPAPVEATPSGEN